MAFEFSQEEWEYLNSVQRALFRHEMLESDLLSLGEDNFPPEIKICPRMSFPLCAAWESLPWVTEIEALFTET